MNEEIENLIIIDDMVAACRNIMWTRANSTILKMQACYDIMEGLLRLFCINGEKDDVLALIKQINDGLTESIQ